ncbi:hypothetical protein [Paenibacillus agri]|uniref:30S ribosomal protein S21 n=1 Tax=Paenibacillus agri TaxID=2744309 RepID=A0A850EEY8_9BACL|nr:hypothetical protein [Paenibacillus agri]NUU59328.1 hypothetical protein [Paenibacillus agri]
MKQLESRIQETPKDKPLKKAVRAFRKDRLPRLQKYEVQQSKNTKFSKAKKMAMQG